ncbi:MAG: R2-like ligand-binding oxidase [Bacteroidota bacterium]
MISERAEEAATEPEHPSPAQTPQGHTSFKTTTGGLDFNSFPLRLFQKSKKLGIWDPASISFEQDVRDLKSLTQQEITLLMHLTSMFVAGEESVTGDILPLMRAMAKRGWIEEELYLTSFAWEEAKHTEFFSIFLQQVMQTNQDLSHFHSPSYRAIFYDALPKAMEHVLYDHSDAAIAKASTTYNLIVEGTLAETGYHAYYTMLERHNIMPGLREGIGHLKRDEARHIAFGVYLLCRLCAQNTSVFAVIEEQMNTLIEPAIDFINEIFDDYEQMPFGLKREDFIEYALSQFRKRIAKIERATEQGYENLLLDTID